jgi:hypothetical protein
LVKLEYAVLLAIIPHDSEMLNPLIANSHISISMQENAYSDSLTV